MFFKKKSGACLAEHLRIIFVFGECIFIDKR